MGNTRQSFNTMSGDGGDEKEYKKLRDEIKKLKEELEKSKQTAKDLLVQVKIPMSKQLQRIMTRGLKKHDKQLGASLGKKGRRLFDGFSYRVYMEYRVSRANGDDPFQGERFSGDFSVEEMDHLNSNYNDGMFYEFFKMVVKNWNNMTEDERLFFASGCNVPFGSASEGSDYDSDNEDDGGAGAAMGNMSLSGKKGGEFRFGVAE